MSIYLALDLTAERITLLRRHLGCWHRIGAAMCARDLIGPQMLRLRDRAAGETPDGHSAPCFLIIPEDQVEFHFLPRAADDPTPLSAATILERARDASGLPADDLRLDWRQSDEGTRVAILSTQTMREAENFVSAHGFVPCGIICAPLAADFDGAPWFGCSTDETLNGTAPEVDGQTVIPIDRREILAHPPQSALRADPEATARAQIAARLDPAHLVALDDEEDDDDPRRFFWSNWFRRAPKPVSPSSGLPRARIAAVGLICLALFSGYLFSLRPDDATPTAQDLVAPVAEGAAQASQTAKLAAPTAPQETAEEPQAETVSITDFDRASAFTPGPRITVLASEASLDALEPPGVDPTVGADASAVPWPIVPGQDDGPQALPTPPPSDRTFALDERGFVRPHPDGQETPNGYTVFAGSPPKLPSIRPEVPAWALLPKPIDPSTLPEGDPLLALRPVDRPEGGPERFERSQLGGRTYAELAALRPAVRPGRIPKRTVVVVAAAPTKTTTAPKRTTSAQVAAASTASTKKSVTPIRPAEVSVPTAPSSGSVTERATQKGKLDLSKVNLLGTFSGASNSRALVRLPNGRVLNVSVGDRIDGGRVSAIGKGQLNYSKGGRNVTLKMPSS